MNTQRRKNIHKRAKSFVLINFYDDDDDDERFKDGRCLYLTAI